MSKDQWIADVEKIQEDFCDDKLTADEFTSEMRWMGFNQKEIDEQIVQILTDAGREEEIPQPRIVQVGDHQPEPRQ